MDFYLSIKILMKICQNKNHLVEFIKDLFTHFLSIISKSWISVSLYQFVLESVFWEVS
jgi:hypothetical protein